MKNGWMMPEGFEPHHELQRIQTLRELITECRVAAPIVMEMYRKQLQYTMDRIGESDPANGVYAASTHEIVLLGETIMNRAYGKVTQQVRVTTDTSTEKQVKVYIPENHRDKPGRTIDVESQEPC